MRDDVLKLLIRWRRKAVLRGNQEDVKRVDDYIRRWRTLDNPPCVMYI